MRAEGAGDAGVRARGAGYNAMPTSPWRPSVVNARAAMRPIF